MRYDNPKLRDELAARYVLGSLRGNARQRFIKLAAKRQDWQQAVDWWANRLHLLADTVPAIVPPAKLWQQVQQRLHGKPVTAPQRFSWLQGWAWGSTAVAGVLAFLLVIHPQTPETPITTAQAPVQSTPPVNEDTVNKDSEHAQVALLASADAKPGWMLVLAKEKTGKPVLRIAVMAGLKPKNNKSFELWILPPDKSAPISLGVLPQQGQQQVNISEDTATLITQSGLAVSLEPLGGSPTGGPTGAVLYQGKLATI